jgi:hypothetical protein
MSDMRFIEPCLPTISRTVPAGPQWAYEIKHDGFRFVSTTMLLGKFLDAEITPAPPDWPPVRCRTVIVKP